MLTGRKADWIEIAAPAGSAGRRKTHEAQSDVMTCVAQRLIDLYFLFGFSSGVIGCPKWLASGLSGSAIPGWDRNAFRVFSR